VKILIIKTREEEDRRGEEDTLWTCMEKQRDVRGQRESCRERLMKENKRRGRVVEERRRMEKERWKYGIIISHTVVQHLGPKTTNRTRWWVPLRATTWPSAISLVSNSRELSTAKGQ
jgi:hypothetical protein